MSAGGSEDVVDLAVEGKAKEGVVVGAASTGFGAPKEKAPGAGAVCVLGVEDGAEKEKEGGGGAVVVDGAGGVKAVKPPKGLAAGAAPKDEVVDAAAAKGLAAGAAAAPNPLNEAAAKGEGFC